MKNLATFILLASTLLYPVNAIAAVEFLPNSCIPKYMAASEVRKTKTLAIVGYKGSAYHYLVVFGKRKNETLRAIIRKNGECYLSFVDPGEAYSLSEGVPIPVAKQLALVSYKNAVEKRGGLNSYQVWFSNQGFKSLAPEDAFALKKIGVKIPPSTKILPWSKIREPEQQIKRKL